MQPKKILILSANPKGTTQLRLDEEVREIDAGLKRVRNRDQFVLEQKWAVRTRDIYRAMLDNNPQIIHFSGHGMGDEGLVFEDEIGSAKLVDGEALAGLFKLFASHIECVVLNGCYSEVQANALAKPTEGIAQHIKYVIGMSKAIGDRAAIEFAVGFYDALGAGQTVEFAYDFGCAAIRFAAISEQLIPTLKKKPFNGKSEISKKLNGNQEFSNIHSNNSNPHNLTQTEVSRNGSIFSRGRSIIAAVTSVMVFLGGGLIYSFTLQSHKLPTGTYQATCTNLSVMDGILTGTCGDLHSQTKTSSLKYEECKYGIENIDGRLECKSL